MTFSLYSVLNGVAIELAWAGAIGAIVFGLEYVCPARAQPTIASRAFNAFSVTVLFSVLAMITPLFNGLILEWRGGLMAQVLGNWHASTAAGAAFSTLVYVFVWDFFQYWVHRAEHAFAPLWAIHAFHHEDDQFNGTTSLRNTVWSALAIFFFASLPTLIICGVDMLPIAGAYLFFKVYGFFNHANIRLSLGRLTPVFSGPQWHRLHHGRERDYYNKNFAAFFPVFDIIFGTYRKPTPHEFPETGLVDCHPQPLGLRGVLKGVFAVR